jgi:hypothetical protein
VFLQALKVSAINDKDVIKCFVFMALGLLFNCVIVQIRN